MKKLQQTHKIRDAFYLAERRNIDANGFNFVPQM